MQEIATKLVEGRYTSARAQADDARRLAAAVLALLKEG